MSLMVFAQQHYWAIPNFVWSIISLHCWQVLSHRFNAGLCWTRICNLHNWHFMFYGFSKGQLWLFPSEKEKFELVRQKILYRNINLYQNFPWNFHIFHSERKTWEWSPNFCSSLWLIVLHCNFDQFRGH